MLSKKLRKQLKQFDFVNHPECSHNWVHNAGKQCEWDCSDSMHYRKNSKRVANIYTCTMCGGTFWSGVKEFNIPHYRVKESEK